MPFRCITDKQDVPGWFRYNDPWKHYYKLKRLIKFQPFFFIINIYLNEKRQDNYIG